LSLDQRSTAVHQLQHPLVEHHLCTVRDQNSTSLEFRTAAARLSTLIGVEATRDLPLQPVEIQTPLACASGSRIATRIGLVPILRAGLGMVEPLLALLPEAAVWHLGIYRNEETAEPVRYYDKIPGSGAPSHALVLDPMLATGGSVEMVIRRLQSWGVNDIRVLSLIGSQTGIDRVTKTFPSVKIFVAAIDPTLDHRSYIVPGLGDAGDRLFDTPSEG
jgi:uracil phosphoribosyltransferase